MFLSRTFASSAGDTGDRSPWGDFWFQPVAGRAGGVTADGALRIGAVYACVRVLAESFAVLPFCLRRPRVGGGYERVTDHWLYRLLARRPNRWQSPFEFREMLQGHLAMRGNAYCEIIEDGMGGITELIPLHPDRVTIETVGVDGYRYAVKRQSGETYRLMPGQVWHLRGLSGDGLTGYSPIALQSQSLGESATFEGYSSTYFGNNATPPAWIKFPGKFSDKAARAAFREQVQAAHTGGHRGKLMVLDNGMELHALQVSHKDAQFLEARQFKVSEIARIFRVPPHKIGDLSKATFSNIEQQSIEFWADTMHPWCERWESSIVSQLLGADTELEVEFDMRAQMRGDSASRATYIHSGVLDGWLTRNEGREMEGLDPIDGLDDPLMPLNMQSGTEPPELAEPAEVESPEAEPAEPGTEARLLALLRGNAGRMARRVASDRRPPADQIAEAMGISTASAASWLAGLPATVGEAWAADALVTLARKGIRTS